MTNEIDCRHLLHSAAAVTKPREFGKSFDRSAPIGPFHLASRTGQFEKGSIWLKVNGQTKQDADLRNMMWSVAEQISRLSQAFELQPGDIIYSGSPENVGPVVRGDVIASHIDGLPDLSVKIVLKKRIGARRFSCRVRRQRRLGRLHAPTLSAWRQCRGLPGTSHEMRLISNDRMAL